MRCIYFRILVLGGPMCDASVCDATVCGSNGLSARRVRRTKSRRPEGPKGGPKGHRLEVGARRAPKLLVFNILFHSLCQLCAHSIQNRQFTCSGGVRGLHQRLLQCQQRGCSRFENIARGTTDPGYCLFNLSYLLS